MNLTTLDTGYDVDSQHQFAVQQAHYLRATHSSYDKELEIPALIATDLAESGKLIAAGTFLRASASTFRALDLEQHDLRRIQGEFYDHLYGRTPR